MDDDAQRPLAGRDGARSPVGAAFLIAGAAVLLSLGMFAGSAVATGLIGSADIKDNEIRSRDLRDQGVRATDLAKGSVTSSKIKDGSIGSRDIRDRSITVDDLATNGLGYVEGTCYRGTYVSAQWGPGFNWDFNVQIAPTSGATGGGAFYSSTDGSCSGLPRGMHNLVYDGDATTTPEALCEAAVGEPAWAASLGDGYTGQYPDFDPSWYLCFRQSL